MWNDTIIESIRNTQNDILNLEDIDIGTLSVSETSGKRRAIDHLIRSIKYREHQEREDLAALVADRCDAPLPNDLMMGDAGVKALFDAGMGIGAHTVDHPILKLCDRAETRRQLVESREYLEDIVGSPVRLFAYPNGKPGTDYSSEQPRLVEKLGFKAAVSTAPGVSGAGDDLFQLRRFTPWDRTRHRFAIRMALNLRS